MLQVFFIAESPLLTGNNLDEMIRLGMSALAIH